MARLTAEAVDESTVRIVSEQPNPAVPTHRARLRRWASSTATSSSRTGGTDQPGADDDDTAEEFLNSTSAGSGPYILESFSTTSETVDRPQPGVRRTDPGDVRPHRVPQQPT